MSYQWQFSGTNLPGETAPALALDHVGAGQAGEYRVLITNPAGTSLSTPASLFVTSTDVGPVLVPRQSQAEDQFAFVIQGEVGRRYRIQSSTNLADWSAEASFVSAFHDPLPSFGCNRSVVLDGTGTNLFALPCIGPRKFMRAAPFHAVNEVCNNNLKRIRFAQVLWAYDNQLQAWPLNSSSVSVVDLLPYLKDGQFPQCPSGGFYELFSTGVNPQCSTGLHPFEEQ